MQTRSKIDDCLDRWEDARHHGRSLSLDALCAHCPELRPEVERRVQAMRWISSIRVHIDPRGLCSFADLDDKGDLVQQASVPAKLGRYELREPVGAGGFGQVWRAIDPQLNRQVAIKIPHAHRGDHEAYLQEARRVAQLRHPSIVRVFDVGSEDAWCYVVSEFIEGGSLERRLRAERWPWERTVELIATVADALHHAHELGFIHRDVKPGNILLDKWDRPYLCDFGIAVTATELQAGIADRSGTPAYMSPEQIRGNPSLDGRSDLFSLGIVLYEMLAGVRPFLADDLIKLREAILHQNPRPIRAHNPDVPTAIEALCWRSLAKVPELRSSTAAEFAKDLRSLLQQPATAGRRTTLRRVLPLGIMTGLGLGVVVLASNVGVSDLANPDPKSSPVGHVDESKTVTPSEEPAAVPPVAETKPAVVVPQAPGDPPAPYRFTFGHGQFPVPNQGTGPRDQTLRTGGVVEVVKAGDADAPPAAMGGAVRFRDGSRHEWLRGEKTWIGGAQWSISMWFRRSGSSKNVDTLFHQGEWGGLGSEGCPHLHLWLTGDRELRIINFATFRSSTCDCNLTVPGVESERWHHLVMVFQCPEGTTSDHPGNAVFYLDGKEVARKEKVYLGISHRNTKSRLVFGAVYRQQSGRDRTFNGALADVRIYDRVVTAAEVAEMWRAGEGHMSYGAGKSP